mgnify:FL=1
MIQNRVDAYGKSVLKLILVKRTQKMLQKIKKHQLRFYSIIAIFVFVLALGVIYASPTKTTQAESLTELRAKEADLQAKIEQSNAVAADLAAQGETLKAKIAEFDGQIAVASEQISLINIKLSQLELELIKTQTELDRQKELLRASVVALYKKGGASTVELLVGSDSFTTFFNEQTYLERLKTGVQESTEKVIALKQQIQTQKDEQSKLLEQQKAQQALAESAKTEKQQVLTQTQGQENAYRERSKQLLAEQRAAQEEIIRKSVFIGGSSDPSAYPYKNAVCVGTGRVDGACYDFVWELNGRVIEEWTYYMRNCTSYVAYRVAGNGHINAVKGLGNGGQWYSRAAAKGIEVGQTPRVGAAVSFNFRGSPYGHVAYVEQVLDGGRFAISEYNMKLDGTYTSRIINSNDPTITGFVYF